MRKADVFNVYLSNCLKGVVVVILLFHHCFLKPDRYKGHTLKLLFSEYYLNYLALFGKYAFHFCVCKCIWTYDKANVNETQNRNSRMGCWYESEIVLVVL